MVNIRGYLTCAGKSAFKLFPLEVRLWDGTAELELSYMYDTDTHRLDLAMSTGNARVDHLQSEVAELRRQLSSNQGEIRALRWEVTGQYVPWSFLTRVLDGCRVVILLVIFLMLMHASK